MLVMISIGGLGGGPAAQAAPLTAVRNAPMIPAPGPHGFHAASTTQGTWSSSNWSGYAITGFGFTGVTGQWTVPTVTAPVRQRAHKYSSTWVGIDGFNDPDLIQAGTEQDWRDGAAVYYAWWEVLPAYESPITMSVHPGDTMAVSITQGFPDWTITVSDVTTGQSVPITTPYSGSLTSAEWIQEAPTVGCCVARLAHDSTVDFDFATANGLDPGLIMADSGTMVKGRKVISSPSQPNPAGDGFAVAYGSDPPPAPAV
jgi:hypothetical protein